jgi:hypothetical protein
MQSQGDKVSKAGEDVHIMNTQVKWDIRLTLSASVCGFYITCRNNHWLAPPVTIGNYATQDLSLLSTAVRVNNTRR